MNGGCQGLVEREKGSGLMGRKFQFCQVRRARDCHATIHITLTRVLHTYRGLDDKFYVTCIV